MNINPLLISANTYNMVSYPLRPFTNSSTTNKITPTEKVTNGKKFRHQSASNANFSSHIDICI